MRKVASITAIVVGIVMVVAGVVTWVVVGKSETHCRTRRSPLLRMPTASREMT